MRYVRIFALFFQDAFVNRGRSFIWFLLSLLNPLMVLFFWHGAFQGGKEPLLGWSYQSIAAYYLFLVVAGSFLQVHIEEEVARRDIQSGFLSMYLTRPFPYILMKYFGELSWRLIQGFFGVVTLILISLFFGNLFFVHDGGSIAASVLIIALASLISFFFKMIVGLSALWIIEYHGLQELISVMDIIFAGFIMPIALFPPLMKTIAFSLPFSYMIYFPVISVLGKLTGSEVLKTISIQIGWLVVFLFTYTYFWRKGIRKFSGLGQ